MTHRTPPRAVCSVETLPLWRIRLARRVSRFLLFGIGGLVALVCLRLLAAAPSTRTIERGRPSSTFDLAAAGFASEFARDYLSWRANEPEAHRRALAAFAGSSLAPEGGLQTPLRGSRQVRWDLVVQERDPRPSLHVYTVAVDTQPGGIVYLAVSVARLGDGRIALASYPAFVGAPATTGAEPTMLDGSEVDEPALETVVERALRNYLAPAPEQLAADLAPGAKVSTPAQGLRLETVERLLWGAGGPVAAGEAAAGSPKLQVTSKRTTAVAHDHTVVAVVAVSGAEGARYTLAYEIELRLLLGRWEVVAIEMSPDQ